MMSQNAVMERDELRSSIRVQIVERLDSRQYRGRGLNFLTQEFFFSTLFLFCLVVSAYSTARSALLTPSSALAIATLFVTPLGRNATSTDLIFAALFFTKSVTTVIIFECDVKISCKIGRKQLSWLPFSTVCKFAPRALRCLLRTDTGLGDFNLNFFATLSRDR